MPPAADRAAPPHAAVGARRRSADRTIPWLALVVIAEGEGEISAESPIAECVTPGVTLDRPERRRRRGIYLSVPKTTVTKVFPTKQDLQLLAHVREVDLERHRARHGRR